MDVLTDVLDHLRLEGSLYFSTELGREWGIRVPSFESVARFHLVIRGACWVQVAGLPAPLHLDSGDMILVPHGAEHVLSDRPGAAAKSVDDVVEAAGFDGRGALVYGVDDEGGPTRMVCGHLAFDSVFRHPLLDQLPATLVLRKEDTFGRAPLQALMSLIAQEVLEARPGYEAVARRLSEVVFVHAVRRWAEGEDRRTGLLEALADPRVAPALEAIHARPQDDWTLEALARRSLTSRTVLAERFRDTVGVPPNRYLTQWRMQKARRLLGETGLAVSTVASDVGYGSVAAFSRAFKRETGVSPGQFRSRGPASAGVS